MGRTKRAEQVAAMAPVTSGAATYPLHELWAPDVKPNKANNGRLCAGFLVLPESVGMRPDGVALFCLTCGKLVAPEQGQRAQAERAAEAEGAKPVEKGPPRPGTISEEARAALAGKVPLPVKAQSKLTQAEKKGIADCLAGGFCDGDGSLTALGLDLRARIQRPEVPLHLLDDGTAEAVARYSAAEKKRQRKPRPPKPVAPSAPMVCDCGHGAALHTGTRRGAKGLEPCDVRCRGDEERCGCLRYRQAKPAKVESAEAKAYG